LDISVSMYSSVGTSSHRSYAMLPSALTDSSSAPLHSTISVSVSLDDKSHRKHSTTFNNYTRTSTRIFLSLRLYYKRSDTILYFKMPSVCPSVSTTVSASINPLPSDRLRCCNRYIWCQRSLAVKPLMMSGSPSHRGSVRIE